MQTDIDPEKRDHLLEASALTAEQTIRGLNLRPMNWTTYSLYNRIKDSASASSEPTFTILLFVYLHCAPEAKLRANCAKPEALLPEVFDFMQSRAAHEYKDLETWALAQLEQFAASTTAADNSIGGGLGDPKA
jgi:hypothetical protein